ncbi:uncharacterized protein LOC127290152 [Leptopilina boulardi]|uniref:uncharacterized protein LOC127290152 n=1 Tax=Leptopilina boulardi TaxID=63433 RepID=UPI0021F5AAC3|nr:uncharacterized protein LOC127290152 [Leptopilina boulardi]
MKINYLGEMAHCRRPRGRLRNLFQVLKKFTIVAVSFMILGSLTPTASGEPSKEYQMNDVCKNHFLRDLYRKIDGAVLTSQNERNLDCAITFQTHSILQRFMLRFDRLQLDCNDHLYIYDGAHAVGNFKVDLSCRSTELSVSALYTRTNFVTLKYVTDAWGTDTNGFRLVISAIKDPKHACKDFRCTTKEFCIDTDLVCDGIRHCEDGSDEAASNLCANPEASIILGMETTLFAVAMIFVILSMVGIVAAGVLCFCRQRASTPGHIHNAHNAQNHPPVIFPYVWIERDVNRNAAGYDKFKGHIWIARPNWNRDNRGNDPSKAGKLAAPCGPQARAQRGPGPPLLPGKVRSHGSDSDISSSQKDEWFV